MLDEQCTGNAHCSYSYICTVEVMHTVHTCYIYTTGNAPYIYVHCTGDPHFSYMLHIQSVLDTCYIKYIHS